MEFFHSALEIVIGFILLFLATKLLGKEQISQISSFDFISAMVLGEIIGNALYDPEVGVWFMVMNMVIWVFLKLAFEKISLKFLTMRPILESKPNVVIRDGKIDINELKKSQLHLNQLLMMVREKSNCSLAEVDYAILETDGKLTVIKKPEFRNPTLKDLNLAPKPTSLPIPLIIDGIVLAENLHLAGVDDEWLHEHMRKLGHFNPQQIIYAEITEERELFIAEKVFL